MTQLLIFYIALATFAVALLFLIPSRAVTQPPEKMFVVWEIVFPGGSRHWGYLGGLALLAWAYFLLQDLLIFWKGSPYIMTMIALPNLELSYGIPVKGSYEAALRLVNPSWVWVYLAPAVLFVVNLLLVLRDKLFRKSL
jgi:hypothetical protein